MRESRTYRSVRAKAEWLSYSTTSSVICLKDMFVRGPGRGNRFKAHGPNACRIRTLPAVDERGTCEPFGAGNSGGIGGGSVTRDFRMLIARQYS